MKYQITFKINVFYLKEIRIPNRPQNFLYFSFQKLILLKNL